MRRILIYIGLFIILTMYGGSVLDQAVARQVDEIPPYCLSFASIGAIFQESRMDAWVKINTQEGQAETEIEKIKDSWGLDNAVWKKETTSKSGSHSLTVESNDYIIIWEQTAPDLAYLRISIQSSDPKANLQQYGNKLKNMTKYDWHINYMFSGDLDMVVDDQSMQVLLDTLVSNFKGRQTTQYRNLDSWSATAMSNKSPMYASNKRFEVALRRERQVGKTRIWIGTPSIQNSY